MMTMTTSTASHASPWHSPQAQTIPTPPSTRAASMTLNSNVRHDNNKSSDPPKLLRGNPTKISSPLFNAAVVNTPVDDDIRHPQPTKTAPSLASLQEWNDFRAGFDEFFLGFAQFRNKYGPSTQTSDNAANNARTCSVDDDDGNRVVPAGGPEFLRVIGELETVNQQFSQLLDRLENAPHLPPLHKITSNPQQPQTIPCVEVMEDNGLTAMRPPPAPDPADRMLIEALWPQPRPTRNNSLTTTHNVPIMMEDIGLVALRPPPAPDPVNMVLNEVLWPQPRPARKTIPFKKKPRTKHTSMQCRDQDLRPP